MRYNTRKWGRNLVESWLNTFKGKSQTWEGWIYSKIDLAEGYCFTETQIQSKLYNANNLINVFLSATEHVGIPLSLLVYASYCLIWWHCVLGLNNLAFLKVTIQGQIECNVKLKKIIHFHKHDYGDSLRQFSFIYEKHSFFTQVPQIYSDYFKNIFKALGNYSFHSLI